MPLALHTGVLHRLQDARGYLPGAKGRETHVPKKQLNNPTIFKHCETEKFRGSAKS